LKLCIFSCLNYQLNVLEKKVANLTNSTLEAYFKNRPEKLTFKNDILNIFSFWVSNINYSRFSGGVKVHIKISFHIISLMTLAFVSLVSFPPIAVKYMH